MYANVSLLIRMKQHILLDSVHFIFIASAIFIHLFIFPIHANLLSTYTAQHSSSCCRDSIFPQSDSSFLIIME